MGVLVELEGRFREWKGECSSLSDLGSDCQQHQDTNHAHQAPLKQQLHFVVRLAEWQILHLQRNFKLLAQLQHIPLRLPRKNKLRPYHFPYKRKDHIRRLQEESHPGRWCPSSSSLSLRHLQNLPRKRILRQLFPFRQIERRYLQAFDCGILARIGIIQAMLLEILRKNDSFRDVKIWVRRAWIYL